MPQTISVIIITYNRLEELQDTIENVMQDEKEYKELIIVDNASTVETQRYGEKISQKNHKIKYFRLESNLGVAGGRNYAIRKATGDILVFLDDDAIWGQKNTLAQLKEKFLSDLEVGILAFRIVNYYTKEDRREEFPFTDKSLPKDKERLTSTFIGAGHAIRRELFIKCGMYPEDFFYGGEELDFSFRVINSGYKILYFPRISVFHKQSVKGRMRNDEKWIMTYRNRMIISYKYLSSKYKIPSNIIWFAKIAAVARSIRVPFVAINRYKSVKRNLKKLPLNKSALQYMKKNYGRLWY